MRRGCPGPDRADFAEGVWKHRGHRWFPPPPRCPEGPAGETLVLGVAQSLLRFWGCLRVLVISFLSFFFLFFFPLSFFFLPCCWCPVAGELRVPARHLSPSLAAPPLRACPGPTASAPRASAAPHLGQAPSSTAQLGAKQRPGPMATPTHHLPTGPRARRPPACRAGGGVRKTTSLRRAGAAGRAAAG